MDDQASLPEGWQAADITELAALGEQFPLRLMQLGFHLMQMMDGAGHDQFRYVVPPICEVPAGPFLMGSVKQRDPDAEENEVPQHMVPLETYSIGTYPLTVAEYACFVQATRYAEPDDWSDQQLHRDHPVVSVSWNDVLTYARWLAEATGERWRLPTEAEWEKAARGTNGHIFPWGNQWDSTLTNTRDGGPNATTPVGSYPSGVSPYGALDMAGNVYEWTSTTSQLYPYRATDGREDLNNQAGKILRGGAWNFYLQYARAAFRGGDYPSFTINYVGVRLARGGVAG
jgi:formylglycine-generating enzyme required for sulfatase activity